MCHTGACPGGFPGCPETPPPSLKTEQNILVFTDLIFPCHLTWHTVSHSQNVMKPGFINLMTSRLLNWHLYVFSFLLYDQQRFCSQTIPILLQIQPWTMIFLHNKNVLNQVRLSYVSSSHRRWLNLDFISSQ